MKDESEDDIGMEIDDTGADNERTVMVVEITGGILKNIRSTRKYANLSGHDVDFIAFLTHQGTYLSEVRSTRKKVALSEVYKNMESDNKTNMYTLGPLVKHPLKRNSKVPRGKKRITTYGKFMKAKVTTDLFRAER